MLPQKETSNPLCLVRLRVCLRLQRAALAAGDSHVCTQFSDDYSTCLGPADQQCIVLGKSPPAYCVILMGVAVWFTTCICGQAVACVGVWGVGESAGLAVCLGVSRRGWPGCP